MHRAPSRVAFVAGTLGRGGAEQQLVYMVRALRELGVDARVFALTRGEPHEATLRALGAPVTWVGRYDAPAARVLTLVRAFRAWRPEIVQSAHFFTNLHTALAARAAGALSIGAVRGDLRREMAGIGVWAGASLRAPNFLLLNSRCAARQACELGALDDRVALVENVIDLAGFDARFAAAPALPEAVANQQGPLVVAVGTHVAGKRFDRFLRALAAARVEASSLCGALVGDGPERPHLEGLARDLGLVPDGVYFAGRREDVTPWLRRADLLALTSDHEGTPNVLLEAMAARLPSVATDVGDVRALIQEGATGFVVEPDDDRGFVGRLVELAGDAEQRSRFGATARARVEARYDFARLGPVLLGVYDEARAASKRRRTGSPSLSQSLSSRDASPRTSGTASCWEAPSSRSRPPAPATARPSSGS